MSFYDSPAWQHKRQMILRRDGYEDKVLARYGKRREAQTVHHVLPVEYYPEYRLASWNLISICNETHNRLHDRTKGGLTEEGLELARRITRKAGVDVDWSRLA